VPKLQSYQYIELVSSDAKDKVLTTKLCSPPIEVSALTFCIVWDLRDWLQKCDPVGQGLLHWVASLHVSCREKVIEVHSPQCPSSQPSAWAPSAGDPVL
jgi:hypothetical protein